MTKITDWYVKGFNKFHEYCTSKGLMYMEDLDNINLIDISSEKGVGPTYVSRVILGYKKYCESTGKQVNKEYEAFVFNNPCLGVNVGNEIITPVLSNSEYWGLELALVIKEDVFSRNITEIFDAVKDKRILDYCEAVGITTLGQLYAKRLDEFSSLAGIGQGKVVGVKEQVKNYITLYSQNKLADLDAQGFSYKDFMLNLGKNKIINKIPRNVVHSTDIADLIMDSMASYPNSSILIDRKNQSLQEIGTRLGVTRERIRQKEKKISDALLPLAEYLINKIYDLKGSLNPANVVWYEDIESVVGDIGKRDFLLAVLSYSDKKPEEIYNYAVLDEFSCVLIGKKRREVISYMLQESEKFFASAINISDIAVVENFLDSIGYGYLDASDFIYNLLLMNRYKKKGDYISKNALPRYFYAVETIKELFPYGLHTHQDADLNLLREALKKRGIVVDNKNRALSVSVERFMHLCGKGTYCTELPDIQYSLCSGIIDYIEDYPADAIPYGTIYSAFENNLKSRGYDNAYMLHSYLKDLYGPEYCGRDYFKKHKGAKLKIKDLCYEVLDKTNVPTTAKECVKEIGDYNEMVLMQSMLADPRVLLYGEGRFVLKKNYELDAEILDVIRKEIDNCIALRGGYCKDEMVFNHLKGSPILSFNGINSAVFLYSIIESYLGTEYIMQRPIIYSKMVYSKPFKSYYDLLISLTDFDGVVNYKDFKSVLSKDCNYSQSNWLASLKKEYVQISGDLFIKSDIFAKETFTSAASVIKDFLGRNDYALVKKEFDFSRYKEAKYSWNPYLLQSYVKYFGEKHGVMSLEPLTKSYKYSSLEKDIIAKISLNTPTYNDLALKIIKEDGKAQYAEGELASLLFSKGFITGGVPLSIRADERLKYEDGNYTVL